MKTKKLGSSEVFITEQVLGTWAMGGEYFGEVQDKESVDAIRASLETGMTSIDTAYIYGNGRSEIQVGKAVKGFDRESLQIITKLWKDSMPGDKVEKACDDSLRRLDTDYIDVYFIHYPSDDGVPIGETMEVLNALKDKGKIRCIGVSNFSKEQLIEAREYGPVDVIQPCYSLVWRFLDLEELSYCKENNIGIVAYSPLAQGILTGKFSAETRPADGRGRVPLFTSPYYEGALEVTEKLRPYAEKYGVTLAQLAIRWIMQTPGITAPIVGAKRPAQVIDNAKACDFVISAEDYAAMDEFSKEFAYKLPRFKNFFSF